MKSCLVCIYRLDAGEREMVHENNSESDEHKYRPHPEGTRPLALQPGSRSLPIHSALFSRHWDKPDGSVFRLSWKIALRRE
jgi:hypothetical protein